MDLVLLTRNRMKWWHYSVLSKFTWLCETSCWLSRSEEEGDRGRKCCKERFSTNTAELNLGWIERINVTLVVESLALSLHARMVA